MQDTHDILLTNDEDQEPVLRFDGVGGIVMSNVGRDRKTLLLIVVLYLYRVKVTRIEISGLEIIGPNDDITYGEAMENRLIKSNKFVGRGIVAWSGNNIRIHNNKVHHCPHSGIRVDKGDYISIEHNEVYSNTWWGSSAESAVVIAEATDIDHYSWTKIFLLSNRVYDNRNFIPFYNENAVDGDHDVPDYGTEEQTYIIDGSGVYVTRNSDTYKHGRMRLNHNKAYNNGINGLVVHKTDRAEVVGNVLWDNGQVPKSAPESRQPYAGLTVNTADTVEVRENYVKTELHQDYAYMAFSSSHVTGDTNWVG